MSKTPKMEMTTVLIPENQAMNGFCYNFTKLLFIKLLDLREKQKIWEDTARAKKLPNNGFHILPVAQAIIYQLVDQTRIHGPEGSFSRVERFIEDIQEFLTIFEAKT